MSGELFRQLVESKIEKVANIPLLAILKIEVRIPSNGNAFGPAAADYAINSIAKHLKTKLRNLDSCTRSGCVLTLIMPKTSADDARHASRRITELLRKYLAKTGFETVNINVGVATLNKSDDDTDSIFWNASEDLNQDKRRQSPFDINRSSFNRQP